MASKTIILVGLGTVGAALAFAVYRQNQLKRHVDDVKASDTVATINDNFNFVGNIMDKITTAATGKTRGERNNNPLNIEYNNHNNWRGQTGTDGRFAQFTDEKFGFRAGARILRSYSKRGVNTIQSIVHTFAPSHENDSDHYANMVSKWTGIDKHLPLNVNNTQTVTKILQAMARMEVGKQYPFDAVREGVELA